MHIISWNAEDLRRHLDRLPELTAGLGDPDVLCVQEVRVREGDVEGRARIEAALPGWTCGLSLNHDDRNATFRGGRTYGVATYVRDTWKPRHRTLPWDREGRVLVSEVGPFVIVDVYAVNGTSKPYFDHVAGATVGTRFDFKRAFQRALFEELAALGERAIAIGDWNVSQAAIDTHPRLRTEEPHARARAELAALMQANGFVDAWRALHPTTRGYTWFNPRARRLDAARVDFALVPKTLLPRVREAEILAPRAGSDHAAITLRIE